MRAVSHPADIGGASGTRIASFRRFWAVAARWNSSRAPFGPRWIYSPTLGPHIDTAVRCGDVRLLRGMVPWEQMAVLGAHRAQSSHEPEPLAGMIGGNAAWQFAIPPVEGPVLTA